MKASQFSDAQKAFILRQGSDGVPVADICRKAGSSQATYFNWKKKYEGLQPPEMRRLKQLEDENAKLKKIVADLSLDREMLHDVIRHGNRNMILFAVRKGRGSNRARRGRTFGGAVQLRRL
jgi:putative transposase